jgi:hypothetical protein
VSIVHAMSARWAATAGDMNRKALVVSGEGVVAKGGDVDLALQSGAADPVEDTLTGYDEDNYTGRGGQCLDDDPNTDAAWTPSGFNAVMSTIAQAGES